MIAVRRRPGSWARFILAVVFVVGPLGLSGRMDCQQVNGSQPASPPALVNPHSYLRGKVFDRLNHEPLSGVHVRLIPFSSRRRGTPDTIYGALTVGAGTFSFEDLPPGTYIVAAEKTGFELLPFHQPGSPGEGILIVNAGGNTGVELEMSQRAVLSGHVYDRYNEPVPGVSVEATAVLMGSSPAVRQANTDDTGAFQIPVMPGRYYLRTRIGNGAISGEIRTDGTAPIFYRDTFYPSSANVDAATAVSAKAGVRVEHLDIRLIDGAELTISGIVTGIHGIQSFGVTMEYGASSEEIHSAFSRGFTVDDKISEQPFSFAELQPGYYRIYATSGNGDDRWQSQIREFELIESAVNGVKLVLTPGFAIAGTVKAQKQVERGRTVSLVPLTPIALEGTPRTGQVSADGSFRIGGLRPQRYQVTVQPLRENEFVKAVRCGEIESGEIVDLRHASDGEKLIVTISDAGAEISGEVTDGTAPVFSAILILVVDRGDRQELGRSDLHYAFTGLDGSYSFHGVRPGRYRLFELDSSLAAPGHLNFIRQHWEEARVVEVRERERRSEKFTLMKKGMNRHGAEP